MVEVSILDWGSVNNGLTALSRCAAARPMSIACICPVNVSFHRMSGKGMATSGCQPEAYRLHGLRKQVHLTVTATVAEQDFFMGTMPIEDVAGTFPTGGNE